MTSDPRPGNLCEPVDIDPGAHGHRDTRFAGHTMAAEPKWLKLGIAAAVGLVAGATLFATDAQGRDAARQRPMRRG